MSWCTTIVSDWVMIEKFVGAIKQLSNEAKNKIGVDKPR